MARTTLRQFALWAELVFSKVASSPHERSDVRDVNGYEIPDIATLIRAAPATSFRGDAKHRTRNLEIPGLVLPHHPGMTAFSHFGSSMESRCACRSSTREAPMA